MSGYYDVPILEILLSAEPALEVAVALGLRLAALLLVLLLLLDALAESRKLLLFLRQGQPQRTHVMHSNPDLRVHVLCFLALLPALPGLILEYERVS